jgi:hypothetical protein
MSTGRFAKRDREKARQARAAAKRERRFGGRDDDAGTDEAGSAAPAAAPPQSDVLAALAALHETYDAGRMSLEDSEQARAELVAQIQV